MTATPSTDLRPEDLRVATRARIGDTVARRLFQSAGVSVLFVLGFILYVLAGNSIDFFRDVSLAEFFGSTTWRTAGTLAISEGDYGEFGIWPLVSGTMLVTVGAVVIGLPIGLATAVYLAEYASPRVRGLLKPVLELLAGIPSIVFGFFALHVVSPIIQRWTDEGTFLFYLFGEKSAGIFNAANAIVVVGIMVLPIITSLSEDAIRAVPRHLKEASLGMGATRWETTRKVVLPAALSGIVASFVLGVARAIGESMAVAMAAGTQATFTFNPVDSIQTMTAFIVQRTGGDTPQHGPVFTSLFAVGLMLFLLTLALNLVAQRFVKKYREVDGGHL
ncbi:MAG: phosphate ABC transporter permease subunit PstC [Thermoplasmatota archaeon]